MSDTQSEVFTPTPLAEILKSKPTEREPEGGQPSPAEAAVEEDVGEKAPAEEQQPRDEHGKFVAKPEATATPPVVENEPQHVPIAALKAEREKRQAIERELQELRAKPVEPPPPRVIPNPAEDPAGYHAAVSAQMLDERLNMSEALVRTQFTDVDKKFETFMRHAKTKPDLHASVLASVNPWLQMYREAEKLEALDEIGDDPKAFRDRVRAEILAELHGQAPANDQRPSQPTPSLPTSLASVRSSGSRTNSEFSGPMPLHEIVRFKGR